MRKRRFTTKLCLFGFILPLFIGGCVDGSVVESGGSGDGGFGDASVGDIGGCGACGIGATCNRLGNCTCPPGTVGDPKVDCRTTADGGGASDGSDGVSAACMGVQCGLNAVCRGGDCRCKQGFGGNPYDKCEPKNQKSCGNASCSANARCISNACECDPGFSSSGSGICQLTEPSDPAARTKSQVCQRWSQTTGALSQKIWASAPTGACQLGDLEPRLQREALGRLNLYRWLVGLNPVSTTSDYENWAQSCATVLAARGGGLAHQIDRSFQCYSPQAERGARDSNLAKGVSHPAESIRLWIRDKGVRGLGHRRWTLSPKLGDTGFGFRDSYVCMYAVDGGGSDDQSDIFYPSAGFFPEKALVGPWSYMSTKLEITSKAKVRVTRVSDGAAIETRDVHVAPGKFGRVDALAWRVPTIQPETEYRIQITGLGSGGNASKVYRTTLVNCP